MRSVAVQGERRGVDRLDRAERVALDAGNLHEAADRVAGHAEVMLHADLGGVLDLRIRCRRARRQSPAAAIEQATPTSPWQPTSAPEIEAFSLNRPPIAVGGQQEVARCPLALAPTQSRGSSAAPPGMTPAAPLVGAVTTRPPAAFSSFTAMA